MGINPQALMVEAQLFMPIWYTLLAVLAQRAFLIRFAATVHMHVREQPICQHTKEQNALVHQQMKIVNENLTGTSPASALAKIVHQQPAACIRRQGYSRRGEPCPGRVTAADADIIIGKSTFPCPRLPALAFASGFPFPAK